MRHVRRQLVGYLALFVSLGGTSYAAVKLPRNSVGTSQIAPQAVRGADLADNAVTSAKVRDRSLLARDFRAGQLVAGSPGAPGPKGDGGAAGGKGDPGVPGPKGDSGASGSDGAVGPAGPKGDIGAPGSDGAVGPAGPTFGTSGSGRTLFVAACTETVVVTKAFTLPQSGKLLVLPRGEYRPNGSTENDELRYTVLLRDAADTATLATLPGQTVAADGTTVPSAPLTGSGLLVDTGLAPFVAPAGNYVAKLQDFASGLCASTNLLVRNPVLSIVAIGPGG